VYGWETGGEVVPYLNSRAFSRLVMALAVALSDRSGLAFCSFSSPAVSAARLGRRGRTKRLCGWAVGVASIAGLTTADAAFTAGAVCAGCNVVSAGGKLTFGFAPSGAERCGGEVGVTGA
jgi:hypothetical protein